MVLILEKKMKAINTEYKGKETFIYKGYLMRSKLPKERKRKIRKGSEKIGTRYGRLLVLEDLGTYNSGECLLGCKCDCGNMVAVKSRGVLEKKVVSCGCKNLERLKTMGGLNKMELGQSSFNQIFYNYKKSAKKRGYNFDLSEAQFRDIAEKECKYCGSHRGTKAYSSKGTFGHYFYTGIDRVDNTKGYTIENSVPCCKQCNIAKGVLGEMDFYDWIKKTYLKICETNHLQQQLKNQTNIDFKK